MFRAEQDQQKAEKRIKRLEGDLEAVTLQMEELQVRKEELDATIIQEKQDFTELLAKAAASAATAASATPGGPPSMEKFVVHLGEFQENLAGIAAEGARESLQAKYQAFLDELKAATSPPRPAPCTPGIPPPMEVDEVDLVAAVEGVEGCTDSVKRQILESLMQASKKPRFRSPGPGGRISASEPSFGIASARTGDPVANQQWESAGADEEL